MFRQISLWGLVCAAFTGLIAADDCVRNLRLRLSHSADAAISHLADSRSDPSHPQFRQFVPLSQMRWLVHSAVDQAFVRSVVEELSPKLLPTARFAGLGDWVVFDGCSPVTDVLRLVELSDFTDTLCSEAVFEGGRSCTVKGSLPHTSRLAQLGWSVLGAFTVLPTLRPRLDRPFNRSRKDVAAAHRGLPQLFRQGLGVPSSPPPAAGRVSIGVAEFEGAAFYPSDISLYARTFKVPFTPYVPSRIVGPNPSDGGYLGEASLDTQLMSAVATSSMLWALMIPGSEFDVVSWAHLVMKLDETNSSTAPFLHSLSWGSQEDTFADSDRGTIDAEFAKLIAAGHTIFAASGDDSTGHTGGFLECGTFSPTYPSVSPFVTAVGGLTVDGSAAWPQSGGGFSNKYTRPQWQSSPVEEYLRSAPNLPTHSFWNASGRAVPDIAAWAENIATCEHGDCDGMLSGTSAATPILMGALAVAIAEEASSRASNASSMSLRVGNINPTLYKLALASRSEVLDITSGSQAAAAWACPPGFSASKGWDAVTGFGIATVASFRKVVTTKYADVQ